MKIGIVGWKVGPNSFGITLPYLEYFRNFDYAEIITLYPWTVPEETNDLNLVVIPGGPDINPNNYDNIPELSLSNACPYREHFDRHHLPRYIEMGVPIFGICRGMQAIAIYFGGQLYQNMVHETSDIDKRYEKVHTVTLNKESIMFLGLSINEKNKIYKVNSLHHQSVIEKTLPDELVVIGHYDNCDWDGVEIIAHKTLPIAGVQYHPEELGYCDITNTIINKLLKTRQSLFVKKTIKKQQITT